MTRHLLGNRANPLSSTRMAEKGILVELPLWLAKTLREEHHFHVEMVDILKTAAEKLFSRPAPPPSYTTTNTATAIKTRDFGFGGVLRVRACNCMSGWKANYYAAIS